METLSLWPHRPTAAGCRWNISNLEEGEGRNKKRRWKSGFLLQEIWSISFCFSACHHQSIFMFTLSAAVTGRCKTEGHGRTTFTSRYTGAKIQPDFYQTNSTFIRSVLLWFTALFWLNSFTVLSETDGLLREAPSARYFAICYLKAIFKKTLKIHLNLHIFTFKWFHISPLVIPL